MGTRETEREGFVLRLPTSCLKPPGPGVLTGAIHRVLLPVLPNRVRTRSNPLTETTTVKKHGEGGIRTLGTVTRTTP